MSERVSQWTREVRVIDGGFGSECIKLSKIEIDSHKAWSSRLLKEDPELVLEIHKRYVRSGCDVLSTNTYQTAPGTLAEALDIPEAKAKCLMHSAVDIAKKAIKEEICNNENISPLKRKLNILVAGSLGPFGACQADGSEYTGSYVNTVSFNELVEFHFERAETLVQAGVDFIAWETIPLFIEVSAICEVMRRLSNTLCWISVASEDGETTVGGDSLMMIAHYIKKYDQVFGVGVNCNIPHHLIGRALSNLFITECIKPKILLFYANDGQLWIKNNQKGGTYVSPPNSGPEHWLENIKPWIRRRDPQPSLSVDSYSNISETNYPLAQWVGGCCRVGPELIQQLAKWMKPDEYM